MPGVWDPLSTRLAARAGFDTMFLSGFCVAGTLLGVPDIGILSRDDMVGVARRVCEVSTNIDVVVDADTGYGDESEVATTVHQWEAAGAAGMFLEDQVWPKRCGHMDGKEVVEADEWLAKLRRALSERGSLHVTARTDALGVLGRDEAIRRAKMARDLGVDAVFVEAPRSREDLEAIASAVSDVTLVANMVERGKTPLATSHELAEMGFRLVISPVTGLLASAHAIEAAYGTLAEKGTLRDDLDRVMVFGDFNDIVGTDNVVVERSVRQ